MQEYQIQLQTLRGLLGRDGLLLRCDYDACDVLYAPLWLVVEETVKFGRVMYPPIIAKACECRDDAISLAYRYEKVNEHMARRGFTLIHAYEVWEVRDDRDRIEWGEDDGPCIPERCPHAVAFVSCNPPLLICKRRNLVM